MASNTAAFQYLCLYIVASRESPNRPSAGSASKLCLPVSSPPPSGLYTMVTNPVTAANSAYSSSMRRASRL